jgi:hypothetical protein
MEQSQNTTAQAIADVSRQLAEARDAKRRAEDRHESAKIQAEARLITEVGGIKTVGTNPTETNRAFAIYCDNDAEFQDSRTDLREQQFKVALLEGALEGLRAQLAERSLSVSERYCDLVGGKPRAFSLPVLTEMAS